MEYVEKSGKEDTSLVELLFVSYTGRRVSRIPFSKKSRIIFESKKELDFETPEPHINFDSLKLVDCGVSAETNASRFDQSTELVHHNAQVR